MDSGLTQWLAYITANTAWRFASSGCCYRCANRGRDSGAEQGRIQLRLHRLWLRYRYASSLHRWTRLLRVHAWHAGRRRGLLEPR